MHIFANRILHVWTEGFSGEAFWSGTFDSVQIIPSHKSVPKFELLFWNVPNQRYLARSFLNICSDRDHSWVVCMCAHMCLHMGTCAHGGQRSTAGVLYHSPPMDFILCVRGCTFCGVRVEVRRQLRWVGSLPPHLFILCWFSGPLAYTVVLLTGPSP